MDSLVNLFKIGFGPSSSHTMGPAIAARDFQTHYPKAATVLVTLYGSLAETGKGHHTDSAICAALHPIPVDFQWVPSVELPEHPNGMTFQALDAGHRPLGAVETYYSVGGGTIRRAGELAKAPSNAPTYPCHTMKEILDWCGETGHPIWHFIKHHESELIWEHLDKVWETMLEAIDDGLASEGILDGGLRLRRKARAWHLKAKCTNTAFQRSARLSAYALAVAERNAGGGIIVTSPTCGAAGVLPATLRYLRDTYDIPRIEILHALATAGIIGNLVKHNASISGAEAGCQAEIGTACGMAAAAATQLFGGTVEQIEYAAEMGLEHHLGLTCDPVNGLVQIPCIERNAFAAMRAIDCAEYAILSDGQHNISFDEVVETLRQTGVDMNRNYRETSQGGLAKVCAHCKTC